MRWTPLELKLLSSYVTKRRTVYDVYLDLKHHGSSRTFHSVEKKLSRLALTKNCKSSEVPNKEARIGYLDIETTGLDDARIEYMLTWCIKERDKKKVHEACITRDEVLNYSTDRRITKELIQCMSKFDKVVTYFGTYFDLPFIRTRALYHKMKFLPFGSQNHRDLYFLVKKKLKLRRNTLQNATQLCGIDGKNHVEMPIWFKARFGHRKSLAYVLDHNRRDVAILEKLDERIDSYSRNTKTSI